MRRSRVIKPRCESFSTARTNGPTNGRAEKSHFAGAVGATSIWRLGRRSPACRARRPRPARCAVRAPNSVADRKLFAKRTRPSRRRRRLIPRPRQLTCKLERRARFPGESPAAEPSTSWPASRRCDLRSRGTDAASTGAHTAAQTACEGSRENAVPELHQLGAQISIL